MLFAHPRYLCATSILAITSLTIAAHAQSSDDAVDLGTLILGELQTRSVQDSSTSAVVESGEELEKRGDVDIYDVVERAPNVSTTFGNKGFVLRGIQTNGAVNNVQLNGTLVSVQVDGVALNNYQSTFFGPYSTWDVGQVEILRGPQSTQQGRNALAGAVIINTRDPEFFKEYRFRAEVGSRNTQRLAFAINEPLSDTVAVRFTAETNSTDGYVRSEPRDDNEYDARDYEAYRAKLRWRPSDRFDAVLEYSYTDSTGGEDYVREAERVSFDTADAVEGSVHQNWGLSTRYDINGFWTLETQTNFYDQDYTRLEGSVKPFQPGESFRDFSGDSQTFEQDIQFKYESERVQGVFGLFYTKTEDSRPSRTDTDLTLLGFPGFSDFRNEEFTTEVRNFAIYGEADIALADRLTLTIGARYDTEEFKFAQSVDFGPLLNGAAGIPDIGLTTGEKSFEAFLPKVGLTYDIDPDQSVSFTVQRGYRAGGVSSNFVETLIPGENFLSEYDPEYSNNFELAYRGSFNNDRLRVAGNLFYTDWKDMQISVPGTQTGTPLDPLFNFDTVNAAKAELYGFELSVEAEPTDQLELFGNVGYTKTEFKSFISGSDDFTGNEFPFAPDWTASIGGRYTWDSGFSLAVDASYKAASFQDNANTYKDDSRWLVNAHATYPINDNLTAGIYARNLFDEDYATARFQSADPTIIRVGEPRTIGAYIQAEF
ncbi:TonB-dependent receptor [Tateyamaria sp. syn59]|uniref:TonB-dependent receptor n=1 Tax=Tateyamaria sp. syn59 TaxID=2576942 RepID=UPI0011BE7883|nr:TonB-dependent receptor [Tateyamaria sp. syn59]